MAKPRKEDQTEFEPMRDVTGRLAKTPPKPHKESAATGKGPAQPKKVARPKPKKKQ